jgi:hypothetical protein
MAFLRIYQNGIYTVQRCDYYQQLVPQEKWDMAFLRIYQNGITAALRLLPAACATREKIYTQGHGIPPCI